MTASLSTGDARVERVEVSAYTIPTATDQESDGTLVSPTCWAGNHRWRVWLESPLLRADARRRRGPHPAG
jgi:hypothetical protein